MKTKNILLISIITAFIIISGNKSLGQSVQQSVTINSANFLNVCTDYSSTCQVTIYLEQNGPNYIFNPVLFLRPNGSVAQAITAASCMYVSDGIMTYTINGGFFNVTGNWVISYNTNMGTQLYR